MGPAAPSEAIIVGVLQVSVLSIPVSPEMLARAVVTHNGLPLVAGTEVLHPDGGVPIFVVKLKLPFVGVAG